MGILVITIGNSSTRTGLYQDGEILDQSLWDTNSTDLLSGYCSSLSCLEKFNSSKEFKIEGIAICCVSKLDTSNLSTLLQEMFGPVPFQIAPGISLNFDVLYHPRHSLGPDRLANLAAAKTNHGYPALVIDMGTATTFNILDNRGNFIGGFIFPGAGLLVQSLHAGTARLPQARIDRVERGIGTTTETCIISGVTHGYVSAINGLTDLVSQQIGPIHTKLVTGGWGHIFHESLDFPHLFDPDLTLKGIGILFDLNLYSESEFTW